MFVIGTAGHVDHGKSMLVKSLTGIDPDRLNEEKERGLTIDLGFAWLKLPSGREVSIVDVPGHERFIKNMLAGVGGIDLALLIIAADEGVMPQTREHLAILDLLEVKRGILVITKKDLVDDEWLEMVRGDALEAVKATTLSQAPVIAVSALSGDGLEQLLAVIDDILENTAPREDIGRPRLPIDRVFTMTGFGTVVTGTLIDGSLKVGQEVEIVPREIKSRIRGLQMHRSKVQSAAPGNRLAVNLTGVSTSEISRGDVLTTVGWLRPTSRCDVKLRTVSDMPRPLRHNAKVTFHTGSSETPAKVRLLDRDDAKSGQEIWAQIRLENPMALVKGDFFIIRSSRGTVGGGRVIDTYARRHRRFDEATLQKLVALDKGGAHGVLLKLLDRGDCWEMDDLLARSGVLPEQAAQAVEAMASDKQIIIFGKTLVFSSLGWDSFKGKVRDIIEQYHNQYPLRSGMPKENLKSKLKLSVRAFANILPPLVEQGVLIDSGRSVSLPGHIPSLNEAQQKTADQFIKQLSDSRYSPSLDIMPDAELLNLLIEQGTVVKLSPNVFFLADVYGKMVQKVMDHIKAHGDITVAAVRDILGTSRKYALALMEHLDEQKITRRVGDVRILRAGS